MKEQKYRGNLDDSLSLTEEELYCIWIKFEKRIHDPKNQTYKTHYHLTPYDPKLLQLEKTRLAKFGLDWLAATGFTDFSVSNDTELMKSKEDVKKLEI